MPWDLKKTYALVKKLHGQDRERRTRESARSLDDRQRFARYHFRETIRLSKAFEKHLVGTKTLLEIHALGAEKKSAAFDLYILRAGAHSIAAVQSIHALPDILANTLYFASGSQSLTDKEIKLPRVVGVLKADKALSSLSKQLASATSGNAWRHLAAVSNVSKHRSVVRAALNEDWTGNRKDLRELHVSSFEHDNQRYPSISLRELLEPEYARLSKLIVDVGNELNGRLDELAA